MANEKLLMTDNDLKCIITSDEICKHAYDPETIQQSSEYCAIGETKPKKRDVKVSQKSRTCRLFSSPTIALSINRSFHLAKTISQEYYLSLLPRLCKSIKKKRPELWHNNSSRLHHDYTPSHTAIIINQDFVKNKVNIISQILYSPDLAPSDFVYLE